MDKNKIISIFKDQILPNTGITDGDLSIEKHRITVDNMQNKISACYYIFANKR
jgi:hypothetical protein